MRIVPIRIFCFALMFNVMPLQVAVSQEMSATAERPIVDAATAGAMVAQLRESNGTQRVEVLERINKQLYGAPSSEFFPLARELETVASQIRGLSQVEGEVDAKTQNDIMTWNLAVAALSRLDPAASARLIEKRAASKLKGDQTLATSMMQMLRRELSLSLERLSSDDFTTAMAALIRSGNGLVATKAARDASRKSVFLSREQAATLAEAMSAAISDPSLTPGQRDSLDQAADDLKQAHHLQ